MRYLCIFLILCSSLSLFAETVDPSFLSGPSVQAITEDSFTISASLDETGAVYYIVVGSTDVDPNVAEVLNPGIYAGGTRYASGNSIVAASTLVSFTVNDTNANPDLDMSTAYKVCVIAVDDEPTPNVQDLVTVKNVTMADLTAPIFLSGPMEHSITTSGFTVSASLNEDGKMYYMVVGDGDVAPSVAVMKTPSLYLGGTQYAAGSLAVGKESLKDIVVSSTNSDPDLEHNTAYDVYILAEDSETIPNVQSSVKRVDVKTLDVAPVFSTSPLDAQVSTSTSVSVRGVVNKSLTVYALAIGSGETAPSANQIRTSPISYSGATVHSSSSLSVSGSVSFTLKLNGLSESVTYDVYLIAEDSLGNQTVVMPVIGIKTIDQTAPVFLSGPTEHSITASSFTVSVSLNEDGRVYYMVVGDGDTAPSVAVMKTPSLYLGGTQYAAGSLVVGKESLKDIVVSFTNSDPDLEHNTVYDVYIFAEDEAEIPNVQSSITFLDIKTDLAPSFSATPTDARESTTTSVSIKGKMNKSGRVYAIAIAAGETSPTAEQVKAGKNYESIMVYPFVPTSKAVVESEEFTITIGDLSGGTKYDIYLVAEDLTGNKTSLSKVDGVYTVDASLPTFTDGPMAKEIKEDGFTLSMTLDKDGTVYYIIVGNGDAKPTLEVLKNPSAYTSGTIYKQGTSGALASQELTFLVSGLSSSTDYDVYCMALDSASTPKDSVQVVQVDVTTSPKLEDTVAPQFISGPVIQNEKEAGFTLSVALNETGKVYYMVVGKDDLAPSVTIMKNPDLYLGGTKYVANNTDIMPNEVKNIDILSLDPLLKSNTEYALYVLAEDDETIANVQGAVTKVSLYIDTAPSFTNQLSNKSTLTTVSISVQVDEDVGLYAVAIADTESNAPSAAQVKEGIDYSGTGGATVTVYPATAMTVAADVLVSFTIEGLTKDTAYNVYILAEDGGGKQTLSTAVAVSTIADATAPEFMTTGTPTLKSVSFVTAEVTVTLNEAGALYWLAVKQGAEAPTAGEVKNKGITNKVVLSENVESTFSLTDLDLGTQYNIYCIAEDDEATPNIQSEVTNFSVTTKKGSELVVSEVDDVINTGEGWNTDFIVHGDATITDIILSGQPSGLVGSQGPQTVILTQEGIDMTDRGKHFRIIITISMTLAGKNIEILHPVYIYMATDANNMLKGNG